MQFSIKPQGIWYHGSNKVFEILKEGSTITQWKELAEAFSHKPTILAIGDDNSIFTMEKNMATYILWMNLLKLV